MRRFWFATDDIPFQILSRLSAKTLHHVKYVAKDWLNLVSDRTFIRHQLKKEEPVAGFFFQEIFEWSESEDSQCISYIPLKKENVIIEKSVLDFLPQNVVLLSLNNGLLCCRSCFPDSYPEVYICNPIKKQWRNVTCPHLSRSSSIGLVFDPLQHYEEASTNFTLVTVTRVEDEEKEDDYSFLFDIYSSQEGSWRRSKESCECNSNLYKNKGVLANGILYWLTEGSKILMFDPVNEFSWLITPPLPLEDMNSVAEICIGEFEDKLHYVIISNDGLQLWVIKDQLTSEWILKSCISLGELEKANEDIMYDVEAKLANHVARINVAYMDPLAFKDGILLIRVSLNIYRYEFGIGRMKKLCDVETLGPKAVFSPIVVPYTMSLVPL